MKRIEKHLSLNLGLATIFISSSPSWPDSIGACPACIWFPQQTWPSYSFWWLLTFWSNAVSVHWAADARKHTELCVPSLPFCFHLSYLPPSMSVLVCLSSSLFFLYHHFPFTLSFLYWSTTLSLSSPPSILFIFFSTSFTLLSSCPVCQREAIAAITRKEPEWQDAL